MKREEKQRKKAWKIGKREKYSSTSKCEQRKEKRQERWMWKIKLLNTRL